ncbi:hypothetical protein EJB05_28677, partial [Eragrostis curvula]
MFVATAYSAAASGRALADRRQCAGTERSADAAALSTPCYRSREEHKYDRGEVRAFNFVAVFLVATIFFVMLLDAWLGPEKRTPPGKGNLGMLVFFTGPGLLVTRMLLLHGRPFNPAIPESCWLAIVAGVLGWVVIAILLGVFFGEVAVLVFLWIVVMGLAGLLGYGQGVCACVTNSSWQSKGANLVRHRTPPACSSDATERTPVVLIYSLQTTRCLDEAWLSHSSHVLSRLAHLSTTGKREFFQY